MGELCSIDGERRKAGQRCRVEGRTMNGSAALLSAKEWVSIAQLARHWSNELALTVSDLQNAIIEAAYAGEFDDLPDGHGLCISETTNPVVFSTRGSALRSRLKAFT